jgi:di/tricarboxylate transporter
MITGPAGYTARDLWRVGVPLSLGYIVIILAMVHIIF